MPQSAAVPTQAATWKWPSDSSMRALDRLAVMNSGLDVEGFFRFHERELSDDVREPRPS